MDREANIKPTSRSHSQTQTEMSETPRDNTWSGASQFGSVTPPESATHAMGLNTPIPAIPGGQHFPPLLQPLGSTVMSPMLMDPYAQYQAETQNYLQKLGDCVKKFRTESSNRLGETESKFENRITTVNEAIKREAVTMKLRSEVLELRLNAKLVELQTKVSQQEEVIDKQAKVLETFQQELASKMERAEARNVELDKAWTARVDEMKKQLDVLITAQPADVFQKGQQELEQKYKQLASKIELVEAKKNGPEGAWTARVENLSTTQKALDATQQELGKQFKEFASKIERVEARSVELDYAYKNQAVRIEKDRVESKKQLDTTQQVLHKDLLKRQQELEQQCKGFASKIELVEKEKVEVKKQLDALTMTQQVLQKDLLKQQQQLESVDARNDGLEKAWNAQTACIDQDMDEVKKQLDAFGEVKKKLDTLNTFHMLFPSDPEQKYKQLASKIELVEARLDGMEHAWAARMEKDKDELKKQVEALSVKLEQVKPKITSPKEQESSKKKRTSGSVSSEEGQSKTQKTSNPIEDTDSNGVRFWGDIEEQLLTNLHRAGKTKVEIRDALQKHGYPRTDKAIERKMVKLRL